MYGGRDSTFIRNASEGYLNDWRPEAEAAQGGARGDVHLVPNFCFCQMVTDRLTANGHDLNGESDSMLVKTAQTELKTKSRRESIETKAKTFRVPDQHFMYSKEKWQQGRTNDPNLIINSILHLYKWDRNLKKNKK